MKEKKIFIKDMLYKGNVIKAGEIIEFDGVYWHDSNGNIMFNLISVGMFADYSIPYQSLKEQYLLNQDVVRVVELRDGTMCFVLKDRLIHSCGWFELNSFTEDMKKSTGEFDIVKVYECPITCSISAWNFGCRTKEFLKLVWERQEKTAQQLEKERLDAELEETVKRLESIKNQIKNLK